MVASTPPQYMRDLCPRAERNDILRLAEHGFDRGLRSVIYGMLNDLDVRMCQVACIGRFSPSDTYATAAAACSVNLYTRMLANGQTPKGQHLYGAMAHDNVETVRWFAQNRPELFRDRALVCSGIECLNIAIARNFIYNHNIHAVLAAANNVQGMNLLNTPSVYKAVNSSLDVCRTIEWTPKLYAHAVIADRIDIVLAVGSNHTITYQNHTITSYARTPAAMQRLEPVFGPPSPIAIEFAFKYENIKLCRYLLDRGFIINDNIVRSVINNNDLKMYEFLVSVHTWTWTRDHVRRLMDSPNLVMSWVNSQTYTTVRGYIYLIHRHNYVHVMKSLIERGYVRMCDVMHRPSTLDMDQLLHANGLFKFNPKHRKTRRVLRCCKSEHVLWLRAHYNFAHPWTKWFRVRVRSSLNEFKIIPAHAQARVLSVLKHTDPDIYALLHTHQYVRECAPPAHDI